ncbi:hypothetical protein [Methanosarcina sp. UBA5]|uniref:hypothetical protein n=1 Tax=Methanosarcina sp. UBA5 TaxID=1915593 RepID=UPI0025D80F7D|nr:hypothetical protein [Methanosarcina sp. UBA5]
MSDSFDDPMGYALKQLWIYRKLIWFLSICLPVVLLWLIFGGIWGIGKAIGNYYRSFYENM